MPGTVAVRRLDNSPKEQASPEGNRIMNQWASDIKWAGRANHSGAIGPPQASACSLESLRPQRMSVLKAALQPIRTLASAVWSAVGGWAVASEVLGTC